jgi:amino-acid N-acetyltransferase
VTPQEGRSLPAAIASELTARERIGVVLIYSAKLPFDDVAANRQDFIVAISEGKVVGCVALETLGDAALLRSLAVAEQLRGVGLGRDLYDRAVARAKEKGLTHLFLLTTTAAPFLTRRGFHSVERSEAPEAMTKSAQFASICPSTAV